MNKEINKCLQTIFLFTNNKQDTKSFLTLTTFSDVLSIQQQQQYESNQLYEIDESNDSQLFFQTEFEQHLDMIYKQSKRKNLKNCSSDIEKQSESQQSQQSKQDALEIFKTSKIHKTVPSLFKDQQYKTIRERIQEKIDCSKKQQNMQVITNRFANASQSPASRYHSKSPQSKFTQDFQKKFQSIKHSPCKSEVPESIQRPLTPKKAKIDSTVQIRLDIQKFQSSQKKSIDNTIKKSYHKRLDSELTQRKSKSPTPKKYESQYLIVNLYQKKK